MSPFYRQVKLRPRERKAFAEASRGGARARNHLAFPAATRRAAVQDLLERLSGSFNVRNSQELGCTARPLPVGSKANGDPSSCCWEVTGRM